MSTIYTERRESLRILLSMASNNARLLIPDLQRPYIWSPRQVIWLVDSLIRGWPFGTLLTWKVKHDDPVRELARPFWWLVDRTDDGDSKELSKATPPPEDFYMLLDGQQRVQSLLLALEGDSWGFKMLDRDWKTILADAKARGARGESHWSIGCLCVDLDKLTDEYHQTKRLVAVDFTKVLEWVVTDESTGQSKLSKRKDYDPPLPKSQDGHFVRLSRLWQKAPELENIEADEADEIARGILTEYRFADDSNGTRVRPLGSLVTTLARVKRTPVTYLELLMYDQRSHGPRKDYDDAIVNIFTRLNTAGRTLTDEDITFAWLKVGWIPAATGGESARRCFDKLAEQLEDEDEDLALAGENIENLVSAITFLWSGAFREGKLLNKSDLLQGQVMRPMAEVMSQHWDLAVEAASSVCRCVRYRRLQFRKLYYSLNALAFLWTWYFGALRWRKDRNLRETQKDEFQKRLDEALEGLVDRWLICSTWAGRWAVASAETLGGFAARLASCLKGLQDKNTVSDSIEHLKEYLEAEVTDLEQDALKWVRTLSAQDRRQVRGYYAPLWIWNRLDKNRWKMAKITLREEKTRRRTSWEVDHIVAWDLWQAKLKERPLGTAEASTAMSDPGRGEMQRAGNELGNCLLLEKNFNISKSNKPLKELLDRVYEFKKVENKTEIANWAKALDLEMAQVDSANTSADVLQKLFAERTARIRRDLEEFVRGTKSRVDIELS